MDRNIIKARSLETKRRRIRKKVSGTAERPRLSVYRSERHIYGQLIDDVQAVTLLAVNTSSKGVEGLDGLKPVDAARKIGELLAEKAQAAGIKNVVFDRGGRRYAGRVAALAEGARSKGLQF